MKIVHRVVCLAAMLLIVVMRQPAADGRALVCPARLGRAPAIRNRASDPGIHGYQQTTEYTCGPACRARAGTLLRPAWDGNQCGHRAAPGG